MSTPTQRLINRLLSLRNRHFLGLDLILLVCSPWLAFAVRTDGLSSQPAGWDSLTHFTSGLITYTVVPLIMRLVIFYRRYWRYAIIGRLQRLLVTGPSAAVGRSGLRPERSIILARASSSMRWG